LTATSTALALIDLDERAFALLERKAKVFSKVPGLKREIQGNAEAVLGICLSLQGYGLPITLPGVNMAFDWIQGEATPSARLWQVLSKRAGYDLDPVEESPARTAIRITELATGSSAVFEYTLQNAMDAGRLDEWVEIWRESGGANSKRYKSTWVIRRNGEPFGPDNVPDWALKEADEGRVKRYDAWWNYRQDMFWKACAVRAIRKKAPHVLLGVEAEAEPRFMRRDDVNVIDVEPVEVKAPRPAGPEREHTRPVGETEDESDPGRAF
jgi:hypothetical protein